MRRFAVVAGIGKEDLEMHMPLGLGHRFLKMLDVGAGSAFGND